MNELNKKYVLELLQDENNLQVGDTKQITFGKWDLTLCREEEQYAPYKYALRGVKIGTPETWGRRYMTLEKALLHIVNRFNENGNIKNKYKTINDFILE